VPAVLLEGCAAQNVDAGPQSPSQHGVCLPLAYFVRFHCPPWSWTDRQHSAPHNAGDPRI